MSIILRKDRSRLIKLTAIAALGILLNTLPGLVATITGIPLYLDSIGTFLSAMLGGTLPAVFAGLISNIIGCLADPLKLYFSVVNTLIGVAASWCFRRGLFKKVSKTVAAIFCFAILSGTLSGVLSWFLGNYTSSPAISGLFTALRNAGFSDFWAQFDAHMIIDIADKTITILLAVGIYHLFPQKLRAGLEEEFQSDGIDRGKNGKGIRRSLLRKTVGLVLAAELLLGSLACGICFFLYRNNAIRSYTETCTGVVESAIFLIDPDRIEEYLEIGRDSWDYDRTEAILYGIKESFPEIEYIYAYQIQPDGCHVVFDLDTPGVEGAEIGSVVEFDESFKEYLPTLLKGGEIDPIITDDTYGWLLTVYKPVLDSQGKCVCYMAADINMEAIVTDEASFMVRMISLFFGVSILIIAAIIGMVKRGMVLPLNSMAGAASDFAHDTAEGRVSGLERLEGLNISTGDEIQNLYEALVRMAGNSNRYIDEVNLQAAQISRMQEEIILDFAEMVEARDKCTGDHIKKTSKYVKAIAEELKREGKFPDRMTDEYIASLVRSAPLHDIGKIKISDLILNKPGKLTDEEFELMKTHTTEGRNILSNASSLANTSGYLNEAIDMASYHHEKWNGMGYPTGISGEQIPLSARIMAVADVFDALISQRSYKAPFSYEKAVGIIKEGSGSHFDPTVVEAFLNIAKDLYEEDYGPVSAKPSESDSRSEKYLKTGDCNEYRMS